MLAGIVHKIITFLRIEEPIIFLGTKHRFFQKFLPLHAFYKTSTIKKCLREELPAESLIEIEFEGNLFLLYKTFTLFVHVPVNKECEAFGQTYIEALAVGIPSIFTLSGVATEFIENFKNALVVPYQNSDSIYEAMKIILKDTELTDKIVIQGKNDVEMLFDLKKTISSLEKLYLI